MDPLEHIGVLRRGVGLLLGAAAGALDQPVPTCPGWDLADLVIHAGTSWGWVADVVITGRQVDRSKGPEERTEPALLGWARKQGDRLLEACNAADPDSDCWTIGPPRSRRFWFRRQALEVTLHAYDAQTASGSTTPFDPEVAADGVDEFLTVMIPSWLTRNPHVWDGQTVHLHQTDGEGEWLVRLGPNGAIEVERSHGTGDVALHGPVTALWLWCWNRASITEHDLEVFGDTDVAARWKSTISF
jgi:uncharacterized protein (TIGR03083 family)